jgi:hypothetical protein
MSGNSMTVPRTTMVIAFAALAVLQPIAAEPAEVYRWVDANGVVNFSDRAPPASAATAGVRTLTLEDSQPAAYDPEQDLFNIRATLERTQALREAWPNGARRGGSGRPNSRHRRSTPSKATPAIPGATPMATRRCAPAASPRSGRRSGRRRSLSRPTDETATWRPPGRSGDQ